MVCTSLRVMGGVLAALCWTLACPADELATRGRAVFEQYQKAVVTLHTVVQARVSLSGKPVQTNDSYHTISGTLVAPSGLTAVSLSALDPSQALKDMAAKDPRLKVEAELTEVKILFADGTEAVGEVAGREAELDLAFVRPKTKPAAALTAVDLTKAGTAAVLDPVVALNRLGSAAEHAFAASLERVSAVVTQPRRFYVPEAYLTTSSLGAPAFTLEGKVLGIFVLRNIGTKAPSLLDVPVESLTGIILPAAEILKAAQKTGASQ